MSQQLFHRRALLISPASLWYGALFCSGAAINAVSYRSVQPAVVSVAVLASLFACLSVVRWTGEHERRMLFNAFAVNWLMAGVAAVYANQWHDAFQLSNDAGWFFEHASQSGVGAVSDLRSVSEGALAIVIWAAVYDLFAAVGIERAPFVGILVNVSLVAITGVCAVRLAISLFGRDDSRLRRLTRIYCGCALLWLFGALHLRDAFVLLAATLLLSVWAKLLIRPTIGLALLRVVAVTALLTVTFALLRSEFVFLPALVVAAAVGALVLGRQGRRSFSTGHIVLALAIAISAAAGLSYYQEASGVISSGGDAYREMGAEESSQGSLGMALIVSQPAHWRLLLGVPYLFIFPIPFWQGFQLQSAYDLFKTLNVLLFYLVIPLWGMALWRLVRDRSARSIPIVFLTLFMAGVICAVALTSLESRHLGAFAVPLFIIAILPDLTIPSVLRAYQMLTALTLVAVAAVHVSWAVLKAA